mmetsp:Transcript_81174/g.118851  ORF Transcript_81174/g.118851 Transcript_81174/m.118851 type:complete len:379 (-) Transcript_81174:583-1719(-)
MFKSGFKSAFTILFIGVVGTYVHCMSQSHITVANKRIEYTNYHRTANFTGESTASIRNSNKSVSILEHLPAALAPAAHAPSQWRSTNRTEAKTLVVYSGPTNLVPSGVRGSEQGNVHKSRLYIDNFKYFLAHGIDCNAHDTVIVLTQPVIDAFASNLHAIKKKCVSCGHELTVLARENKCYDMESVRLVFEKVNLMRYDYFVYLNCGMLGPKLPLSPTNFSWTSHFISLLSSSIRMSGLSINCAIHPHVQSFLFVLDKVGLDIVKNSSAVYNCQTNNSGKSNPLVRKTIIERYEVGMSKAILEAGYGIAGTLSTDGFKIAYVTPADLSKGSCKAGDPWFPKTFPKVQGNYPKWQDVVFWKVSRFIPPEILAEKIYSVQ